MDAERFWAKVDRSGGPEACWPWLAGGRGDGYGAAWWDFGDGGSNYKAPTVAFRLAHGYAPRRAQGRLIRHSCDNRLCCNPGHLIDGTPAQNAQDMVDRGRSCVGHRNTLGERNGLAKLTEEQAAAIKARRRGGESLKSLASEFGVSIATVCDIDKGRGWPHLT